MIDPKTLLDDWVQTLPPKEYKRLSPSSLGGCPRVHYWKLTGVEASTPPTPAALLNFQLGFLWEGMWEKALAWSVEQGEIKSFLAQQYFEDEETNLGGTIDFLIERNDGKWEIWDSKTQRSEWFWYTQKRIDQGDYDELKEEYGYIIQQAVYIYLARKHGYDVEIAKLGYVSKDDSMVGKITNIRLTPKLQAEMLQRAAYINECLKNKQLPRCECEGWKVGYCNYGNLNTQEKNRKGKWINSECCLERFVIKETN